jgi:hypothetical protein
MIVEKNIVRIAQSKREKLRPLITMNFGIEWLIMPESVKEKRNLAPFGEGLIYFVGRGVLNAVETPSASRFTQTL